MAKKKSKEELDIDDSLDLNDEEESSGGNKLLNAFIVVVVIAIWLVIVDKDECRWNRKYAKTIP